MIEKKAYKLYLCTDRGLSLGRALNDTVMQAIDGGVTMVQLREKDVSSGEFYDLALSLHKLTKARKVPLIINDRLDIAFAVNAEGVHLGQSDLPLTEARRLAAESGRRDFIIGVSAGTGIEALEAEKNGADYIGAGAIYATGSKTDAGVIGTEGLREICAAVKIPVVAIGGVKADNARLMLDAGAAGIAVISAIVSQPDIRAAAGELLKAMNATG